MLNKKKVCLIFFYIFLTCNIIYIIISLIPFCEILFSDLRQRSKGIEIIHITNNITIGSLFFFLLVRFVIIITGIVLLFKKNKFGFIFFIICSLPLFYELSRFCVTDVILYIKELGFPYTLKLFYREFIYLISFIMVVIICLTNKFIIVGNRKWVLKEVLLSIVGLIIFFFLYVKSNLFF